jgi:uncharacterized protein YbaP (TraB family)
MAGRLRKLPILAAVLLLSSGAGADPAAWQITAGEATTIWLLGSVHYLRDQDYPLPRNVDVLYDRADQLVMEIDLDDLDPNVAQSRFMQAALLTPPTGLRSVLSPDIYADAAALAGELGLDLVALDRFEPWLVALTLMDLGMSRLGYRADRGLEQTLVQRARRDGKPVVGLETLSDQIAIFDGLSEAEQQTLLAQTLDELRTTNDDMNELIDAWRSGTLDTLTAKLSASFRDFPQLYQTLVVERNRRWIDQLERLGKQRGNFLVVVGALHLTGDDNVIEMLGQRGIRAVPLAAL